MNPLFVINYEYDQV